MAGHANYLCLTSIVHSASFALDGVSVIAYKHVKRFLRILKASPNPTDWVVTDLIPRWKYYGQNTGNIRLILTWVRTHHPFYISPLLRRSLGLGHFFVTRHCLASSSPLVGRCGRARELHFSWQRGLCMNLIPNYQHPLSVAPELC